MFVCGHFVMLIASAERLPICHHKLDVQQLSSRFERDEVSCVALQQTALITCLTKDFQNFLTGLCGISTKNWIA